jgi:hypothetical protein
VNPQPGWLRYRSHTNSCKQPVHGQGVAAVPPGLADPQVSPTRNVPILIGKWSKHVRQEFSQRPAIGAGAGKRCDSCRLFQSELRERCQHKTAKWSNLN